MGRGRAKAKQTKVARELKYSSPNTDFTSLQQELSGHAPTRSAVRREPTDDPESRYSGDDWDERTGT